MYTLVQHSGYGRAGKPDFARAVEEAYVDDVRVLDRVRKEGGLVFISYGEASKYAMEINYPPEAPGLVPRAQGRFHPRLKVGGLCVYLPSERDRALVALEEIMES